MDLSLRIFYLQKSIREIEEMLKILKPGEDKEKHQHRLLDYQKQLKIINYQINEQQKTQKNTNPRRGNTH